MNLVWIAAVTILVLLEKTVPDGHWTSRLVGPGLMLRSSAWGGRVLLGG